MSLEDIRKINTKSFPYLFPMVVNKSDKLNDYKDNDVFPRNNFVNVFRYCEFLKHYDKHLFIIYAYSPTNTFELFINKLKKNKNFVEYIELDKYSIMLVYKIPTEYHDCLNNFDNGKFSKFKNSTKIKILDFFSVSSNDKFGPVGVLFKKDWRKEEIENLIGMKLSEDAELSSIPDRETETYFNNYIYKEED
jgi:hypothetical protein